MKRMKSIGLAVLFGISAISFYQCTNDEELFKGFYHEPDFQSIQDIHDQMTISDTVTFAFTDLTSINFSGPGGIRISFPDLTGGQISTPLTFKLIEVFKRGDIVKHNMQTFKNQTTLVSGGIFWLKATDASGQEIQLQNGKAFIPYKTKAEGYQGDMTSHIGQLQTSPSGNVNSWQTGTFPVTFDPLAGVNGEFLIEGISSGWNSAQASFDYGVTDPTQFSVVVNNSSNLEKTQVFFVSNDFTLVAALTNVENGKLTTAPATIPPGMSGKLIAIALIDGKLNFAATDVVINGNDEFNITVSEGELNALIALLSTMN